MSDDVLLFYHTHTPDSNRFESELRDLPITTHATDYVRLTTRLPSSVDAIFVKTDHWRTDPAYFDRLSQRLADRGSSVTRYESHVAFTAEGSTGIVINGVETAVEDESQHVVIAGLPLSDDQTYHVLTLDELLAAGENAWWIAPAHIGMPSHRYSMSLLGRIFDRTADRNIPAAIGYPTGYFPLYNRLARNEVPFRSTVREIARTYDAPVLPELDLHGVVPDGAAGSGLVSDDVVSELRKGRQPISGLLEGRLFAPSGVRMGLPLREHLRNYAVFIPGISQPADPQRRFAESLPDPTFFHSIGISESSAPLP